MALWSNASQGPIGAMDLDSNISPKTIVNPLGDKVIHADIRVTSIEQTPQDELPASQSGPLLEQSSQNAEEVASHEKASEMQLWWDEAIARNMDLPDGYQKVSVLLIKWDDELDELKTRQEAEELEALFRDDFHYTTELVELRVSSKPQHQLSRHLTSFIEKHDGQQNLMIVYYTGHGVYHEDEKYLELTGSIRPTQKRGFQNEARANWNKAEEILHSNDIEGDVLTILDTCYGSNVQKSSKEDTRTFELLSACGFDMTTAAPGPNSFTRALIDSLRDCLLEYQDRSFTTFHLNQRVLMNPCRRDTPSQLWFRLKHHERHIRLAPLKVDDERPRKYSLTPLPRGYLTLRFALRDESLSREQIEHLTRKLSQAFNSRLLTGLRRIDWLGMKPARTTTFGQAALAFRSIAQWKRVVKRSREERIRQRRLDEVNLPLDTSQDSTFSSPTRKRTRDFDDVLPEPKKGHLIIPKPHVNPPSPPVSDGSRMEESHEGDVEVS